MKYFKMQLLLRGRSRRICHACNFLVPVDFKLIRPVSSPDELIHVDQCHICRTVFVVSFSAISATHVSLKRI